MCHGIKYWVDFRKIRLWIVGNIKVTIDGKRPQGEALGSVPKAKP
jgi:hypothetical protein